MSPEEAVTYGLIDKVLYPEELQVQVGTKWNACSFLVYERHTELHFILAVGANLRWSSSDFIDVRAIKFGCRLFKSLELHLIFVSPARKTCSVALTTIFVVFSGWNPFVFSLQDTIFTRFSFSSSVGAKIHRVPVIKQFHIMYMNWELHDRYPFFCELYKIWENKIDKNISRLSKIKYYKINYILKVLKILWSFKRFWCFVSAINCFLLIKILCKANPSEVLLPFGREMKENETLLK